MLRLRLEQEELADLTFHPSLSDRTAISANSVLKLHMDPSYHLDWRKNKLALRMEEHEQARQRRQQEELQKCTFTPALTDCPEYIKKISQSMALIKAARQKIPPGKPDWK